MRTVLLFLTLALFGAACGSSKNSNFDNGSPDGSIGTGDDSGVFGIDGGEAGPRTAVAHLTGKVLAPEKTIPIANALLYLTSTRPPAIPQNVYCDKCVKLTSDAAYTYSKADGTFDLPAYATGKTFLVVQKGQFRRVREIDIAAGAQTVPNDATTFPAKSDPMNGDDIPKMAVVIGAWDHVEVTLAKLGLGTIKNNGIFGDTVENAAFDQKDPSLLSNGAALLGYHIVFIPCSFSSGTTCNTSQVSSDPVVKQNLKQFVSAGGKVYATDYAYEFVRQPWPGFLTWEQQTSTLGSACLTGAYDSPARVDDPGLAAWLTAIGETNVTLQQNWTRVVSTAPQPGLDEDGKAATITPKVWVTAQQGGTPATVSFENGCGRVLFSTYHTEGNGSSALIAQEKALLYVLLEVGVCVGQPPPPR